MWLATSEDPAALGTAGFFRHQQPGDLHPSAHDPRLQDRLMAYCAEASGVGRG